MKTNKALLLTIFLKYILLYGSPPSKIKTNALPHPIPLEMHFVVKVNAKKSLHYFRRLQGHFQVLEKYQISINKTDKNAINTTMQENNYVNSKR